MSQREPSGRKTRKGRKDRFTTETPRTRRGHGVFSTCPKTSVPPPCPRCLRGSIRRTFAFSRCCVLIRLLYSTPPRVRVHKVWRALAREGGEKVVGGHMGHAPARGDGGAADVGQGDDVGELQDRVVEGDRLLLEDIQPRGGDDARFQRRGQRGLIHHWPAGRVDQDRG